MATTTANQLTEEAARAGVQGLVTYHMTTGSYRLHWREGIENHWAHLGHTEGEARRELARQAHACGAEPRITARMVTEAEHDLWQTDRHGVDIDPARATQIVELGVGSVLPPAE